MVINHESNWIYWNQSQITRTFRLLNTWTGRMQFIHQSGMICMHIVHCRRIKGWWYCCFLNVLIGHRRHRHMNCVYVWVLACFSKCVSLSRHWIKKLNIYTQIAQWSQDQRASFGNMTSSVRIKKIFITLSEVCQCLRYVNHQYNTIGGLCPQFMENNQLLRTFSAYIDFVVVHFVLKYFKFIFVSFICIKVT